MQREAAALLWVARAVSPVPCRHLTARHERLGRWQISTFEWPSEHTAPTLGSMPISSAARRKVSAAAGGGGKDASGAQHARLASWPVQQTVYLSAQYTVGS